MALKTLTIIFLFSTFFSFAQNIKGVVLDKNTNNFLVGVHVYLINSVNGDITNKKGIFKLKIKSKENKNDTTIKDISQIQEMVKGLFEK